VQEEWLTVDTAWLEQAACLDMPVDAPLNEGMQGELLDRCRRCPVRETCLEYALSRKLQWGVFGGTTGNQRRTLSVERVRAISAAMTEPLEV